ncbi:hypothetical protein JMJ77_0009447 [Colletotrichum scovillei]|uniref:Uncharacterized protein n=1 Tax=Colletotrichum scovillei TaxID=1209932 RepID=A0A9P7QXU1_9PEZI|nr:hypothetical protein JMJ77_0009447 [Colletotrichum scovillei]KAG7052526.1 hypothetical protein JMJ78_0005542 [Colletotrichum scovillei]KAG7064818.1 hypothetical protein JMJ76_0012576 [Colletotrichum scovillei]
MAYLGYGRLSGSSHPWNQTGRETVKAEAR